MVGTALRHIREHRHKCSTIGQRALRRAYEATRKGNCRLATALYRAGTRLC